MKAPSLETLDSYVARRLLSRQDLGPLSIYNYTDACVYERAWDEVTLNTRGLIVERGSGEIVALPFPKFFNLGERGIAQDVPKDPPDVVTVKHDGSLGISYVLDGRFRWATRGSFTSPQAQAAQRIWDRHAPAGPRPFGFPEELTLLVEIIAPESRNIVKYDGETLIVLGARNRLTGSDLPYHEVYDLADGLGLPTAERVEGDLAELRERVAKMDHAEEGFVVRWGDYRVKVKSAEYLRVARILSGLNERRIADLWYARRFDLVAAIPEEFAGLVEDQFARMDREVAAVQREVADLWRVVSEIKDRKAFVQTVGTKHPLFGAAMKMFDGKGPDYRAIAYRRLFDGPPRPAGEVA